MSPGRTAVARTSVVRVPVGRTGGSLSSIHLGDADVTRVSRDNRGESVLHAALGSGDCDPWQPAFAAVGGGREINTLRAERPAARAPERIKRTVGVGCQRNLRSEKRLAAVLFFTAWSRRRNVKNIRGPHPASIRRLPNIEVDRAARAAGLGVGRPCEVGIAGGVDRG